MIKHFKKRIKKAGTERYQLEFILVLQLCFQNTVIALGDVKGASIEP
jgi:hypothetical protein